MVRSQAQQPLSLVERHQRAQDARLHVRLATVATLGAAGGGAGAASGGKRRFQ